MLANQILHVPIAWTRPGLGIIEAIDTRARTSVLEKRNMKSAVVSSRTGGAMGCTRWAPGGREVALGGRCPV